MIKAIEQKALPTNIINKEGDFKKSTLMKYKQHNWDFPGSPENIKSIAIWPSKVDKKYFNH